jgi:hypothetical protein
VKRAVGAPISIAPIAGAEFRLERVELNPHLDDRVDGRLILSYRVGQYQIWVNQLKEAQQILRSVLH